MKKRRITSVVLACALAVQAPVMSGAAEPYVAENAVESLQSATSNMGLKKINGKYYYFTNYAKKIKLKNRWKVLKINGKYYKYYFGKDGAAYMGKRENGENVHKVAKIDGAYYGFDRFGHRLKGTYVIKGKLYVFAVKDGKMNGTVSVKLRKACVYERSTATLKKLLRNIGQKPIKTEKYPGCYGDGEDILYYYKNFILSAHRNPDGSEIFFSVMSR